jgi:hypothetical protein
MSVGDIFTRAEGCAFIGADLRLPFDGGHHHLSLRRLAVRSSVPPRLLGRAAPQLCVDDQMMNTATVMNIQRMMVRATFASARSSGTERFTSDWNADQSASLAKQLRATT